MASERLAEMEAVFGDTFDPQDGECYRVSVVSREGRYRPHTAPHYERGRTLVRRVGRGDERMSDQYLSNLPPEKMTAHSGVPVGMPAASLSGADLRAACETYLCENGWEKSTRDQWLDPLERKWPCDDLTLALGIQFRRDGIAS